MHQSLLSSSSSQVSSVASCVCSQHHWRNLLGKALDVISGNIWPVASKFVWFVSFEMGYFSAKPTWQTFYQTQHARKINSFKSAAFVGPFLEAKDVDMQWNQTCIPGPKPPQAQANMLHVVGMMWLPEVTVCLLPRCLHRAPRITSISAHHDIFLLFFLHVSVVTTRLRRTFVWY